MMVCVSACWGPCVPVDGGRQAHARLRDVPFHRLILLSWMCLAHAQTSPGVELHTHTPWLPSRSRCFLNSPAHLPGLLPSSLGATPLQGASFQSLPFLVSCPLAPGP